MKQAQVTIAGDRLLMHNARLANPMDPHTKALKALTSKRKKGDDDRIEIMRTEWEGGLYIDDKLGPYVPGLWLQVALIEGARKRKLGKEFEAHVRVDDEMNALEYKGPRTVAGMWAAGTAFVDCRSVVISGRRVMRARPIFRDWSTSFVISLGECGLNMADVEEALDAVAPYGIGDGRPVLGGKMVVKEFEAVN